MNELISDDIGITIRPLLAEGQYDISMYYPCDLDGDMGKDNEGNSFMVRGCFPDRVTLDEMYCLLDEMERSLINEYYSVQAKLPRQKDE